MIDPEELYGLLAARPFRPFKLLMADGREYTISHPWMISWADDEEGPPLLTINVQRAVRALVDSALVTAAVELAVPPVEVPTGPDA